MSTQRTIHFVGGPADRMTLSDHYFPGNIFKARYVDDDGKERVAKYAFDYKNPDGSEVFSPCRIKERRKI